MLIILEGIGVLAVNVVEQEHSTSLITLEGLLGWHNLLDRILEVLDRQLGWAD